MHSASGDGSAMIGGAIAAQPASADTPGGEDQEEGRARHIPNQRPGEDAQVPQWVSIHEAVVGELGKMKENRQAHTQARESNASCSFESAVADTYIRCVICVQFVLFRSCMLLV